MIRANHDCIVLALADAPVLGQMPSAPVRSFPIGQITSDGDLWCALIGSKDHVIDLTQLPFKGVNGYMSALYIEKFFLC